MLLATVVTFAFTYEKGEIKTIEVEDGKISVDTFDDLDEVRRMMEIDTIKLNYL